MFGNYNLEKAVDKFLYEQGKLDEKSRQIIALFNKTYSKKEIESIVEFLIEYSASGYDEEIKEFKAHYESKIKGEFTVKDIKTFNTLLKVYNGQMKEPKSPKDQEDFNTQNTQTQNKIAEEKDE